MAATLVKNIKTTDGEPDEAPKWSAIKKVGLVAGLVVALYSIVTSTCGFYNSFVAGVRADAMKEQETVRVEERVSAVEDKVEAVGDQVEEVKKSQQLDQIRSTRIETMVEMMLRAQGREPPPKTAAQSEAEREAGVY